MPFKSVSSYNVNVQNIKTPYLIFSKKELKKINGKELNK